MEPAAVRGSSGLHGYDHRHNLQQRVRPLVPGSRRLCLRPLPSAHSSHLLSLDQRLGGGVWGGSGDVPQTVRRRPLARDTAAHSLSVLRRGERNPVFPVPLSVYRGDGGRYPAGVLAQELLSYWLWYN